MYQPRTVENSITVGRMRGEGKDWGKAALKTQNQRVEIEKWEAMDGQIRTIWIWWDKRGKQLHKSMRWILRARGSHEEKDQKTLKRVWKMDGVLLKKVNDSRQKSGRRGGPLVKPLHIFPRKGYNLNKPTKGLEQSRQCQLHLSSQCACFFSFLFLFFLFLSFIYLKERVHVNNQIWDTQATVYRYTS